MLNYLVVATGGALGAMARYWVYNAAPFSEQRSALGTVVINVAGSFLIGLAYMALVEKSDLGPEWRNLVSVGFLGAFTTYSTYSLDALRLLQQGLYGLALAYLLGTLLLCLFAVWAGLGLGRLVF